MKWSTVLAGGASILAGGASALAIFGTWRYIRAQARCDGELLTKLPGRWDAQRLRADHPWLMPEADIMALQVGDPVALAFADTHVDGVGPKDPTRVFLMPADIMISADRGLMRARTQCYVRTGAGIVTEGTLIGLEPDDNEANLAFKVGYYLRPDTPAGAVEIADLI